jgi:hypothetical protein
MLITCTGQRGPEVSGKGGIFIILGLVLALLLHYSPSVMQVQIHSSGGFIHPVVSM